MSAPSLEPITKFHPLPIRRGESLTKQKNMEVNLEMATNRLETPADTAKPNWLLNALLGVSDWNGVVRILPGFLLSVAIMMIAIPITNALGAWLLSLQGIDPTGKSSPISAVLTAIVIGILLRNLIPLPASIREGIQFSTTKILRLEKRGSARGL